MNKSTGIVMFAYNRPDHFGKVFEALKRNPEFKEMSVTIYQDGKRDIEKGRWDEMKDLGFRVEKENRNVKFVSIPKNKGCRKSIIDGITETLKSFDSMIAIEDDVLVSEAFLNYMLKGIEFYKDIKEVGCISGYNHPTQLMTIPDSYRHDIYFTLRTCSWGWATWRDRWDNMDWEVKDFNKFRFNLKARRDFAVWGDDLFDMLKAQIYHKINAWDIALTYNFFKNDICTVYPVKSFVESIGHDNTGDNCKSSNEELFQNKDLNRSKNIEFEKPFLDDKMTRVFADVYKRDLKYYKRKILFKLKKIFVK